MPEFSPRMSWPFPSREERPWFDAFVNLLRSMDASGFASREDRNIILSGGGTITWNTTTGLTWTTSFRVFSPSTGFFTLLAPTTVALADGEVAKFDVVRAPGQNRSVAVTAAPYADNTDNSMLLGMRVGDSFFFRSGQAINNGTSIADEDFFSGGGGSGSFSWKLIPADTSVTVPENQQMVVQGGITVLGELVLDGELALI